jgi:hypothetical protein
MRLNRGALILSSAYVVIALALFAVAHVSFGGDVKGQVVFKQLAVAPAMMLLTYTGLIDSLMKALPWMNSFYVYFALSLIITYLIGWGMSVVVRTSETKSEN